jgi:hypothetical protein
MRIESIVIPTFAPADLQAVSIACKREKTERLAWFMAPGVSDSTLERTMSRSISCHHRGFRLGDCRGTSAGRRPGAPHLIDSTADGQPHMSENFTLCAACDCVDDDYYYSLEGAGLFCGECWASLTDADQSLLLEKRLEQYEAYHEELKALLLRAADAIEKVASYASGDPDVYRHIRLEEQNLIRELRKAAEPSI